MHTVIRGRLSRDSVSYGAGAAQHEELPREAEAVVIGGGVTGCAAAYYLAQAGVDVVLLERHDLNTQASGRNAGGLHGQIQHEPFFERGDDWARAFGPSLRLMQDSIDIWSTLEQELETDLEVSICGGLIVASDERQMHALERKAAIDRAFGVPVEMLDRADLQRVAPYVSERMVGALLCPREGKANPLLAPPALAKAARADGARVVSGTEVRAIERVRTGFRVATGAGAIACRSVLVATGADTGALAGLIGHALDVEAHPMQLYATEAVPPLVKHLVYFAGGRLTVKQARHGTLLIGGGWPARADADRLRVDIPALGENLRQAVQVIPGVAGASLLRGWAGICPGTVDHRPLIGEVVPGFFVSMFPFLGFTCGPAMGRLAARLIRGEDPGFDLSPFAPARLRSRRPARRPDPPVPA
jgi:sarcosine oxidase, subunit beta